MFGVLCGCFGGYALTSGVLTIALCKAVGGGGEGGGGLWVCRLSGSYIIVVWANVAIGVAKWTRCRLCGWLDGLCGESCILGLSMIFIVG